MKPTFLPAPPRGGDRFQRLSLSGLPAAAGSLALVLAVLCLSGCRTPAYSTLPQSGVPVAPVANAANGVPEVGNPSGSGANAGTNLANSANPLQEGDVISITFQYSTNFNTLQKIGLDGLINLDVVGAAKAAGKTPTELQVDLARMYKPQIKDDNVSVKLVSTANSVYVVGAVNRPGRVPMERRLTALEAIMEAGGFDPNRARLAGVTVLRLEHGKQRAYRLNLKRSLQGKDETPFFLEPFDIVHVPTKTFNF